MHLRLALLLALLGTTLARADDPPSGEVPQDAAQLEGRVFLTFDTGGHTAPVEKILFGAGGKELVTIATDLTVRTWDVPGRQARQVYRLPLRACSGAAALAPDGRTLAVAGSLGARGGLHVLLLDLRDGKLTGLLPLEEARKGSPAYYGVQDLAFSPDGKRLAICRQKRSVEVWDLATPRQRFSVELDNPSPHIGAHACAFSPDGQTLVVISHDNVSASFYDAESGKLLEAQTGPYTIGLAWGPKDTALVGCNGGLAVWDTRTHRLVKLHRLGRIDGLAWDARTNRVLCVRKKQPQAPLALIDPDSGRPTWRADTAELNDTLGSAVAVSPDGAYALVGLDDSCSVGFFSLQGKDQGKLAFRLGGVGKAPIRVGWHKDGRGAPQVLLGARGEPDRAFDFQQLAWVAEPRPNEHGREIFELEGARFSPPPNPSLVRGGQEVQVQMMARCTVGTLLQGQRLVMGQTGSGALRINSTRTGKLLPTQPASDLTGGHRAPVQALAAAPDQTHFVTAGSDMILCLWDPAHPRPLLSFFHSGEDWVAWTPQGYYAASPGGEKLIGWTVLTEKPGRVADFYPVERFRKTFQRPDIIRLVLEKGSVEAALKAAAARPADVEKLLPPRAEIALVRQEGTEQQLVTVHVTARPVVVSQPVKALRLLLDGRALPGGKEGYRELQPNETAEAQWQVELPPGKHEIRVLVRGPDTADVSAPVVVRRAVAPEKKPVLHLLTVGINYDWDESLRLRCPADDARDIASALRAHCTGEGNRFREARGEPLLNQDATRPAVLDALQRIRAAARPGDLVVFFFAGHGVKEGKEFYLLTAGADTKRLGQTALVGARLRAELKEMQCPVLLIFDACHSAAGIKDFLSATDDLSRSLSDEEAAVTVLTAAMAHETAGEEKGNGLLTRALKKVLAGGEGIPYDPDEGVMHVYHVFSKVYDEVRRESHGRQNPALLVPWTMTPLVLREVTPPSGLKPE